MDVLSRLKIMKASQPYEVVRTPRKVTKKVTNAKRNSWNIRNNSAQIVTVLSGVGDFKHPNEMVRERNDRHTYQKCFHKTEKKCTKDQSTSFNFQPLKRNIRTQTIRPKPFECTNCNRRIIDYLEPTERRKFFEDGYWSEPSYIKPGLKKEKPISPDCISKASIYRQSNYTDTHSPESLLDKIEIPVHTCIHPFKLNERLFTEPETDGLQSKCVFCNIPLITDDCLKGTGIHNYELKYIKKRELLRRKMEGFVPQEILIKIPVSTKQKQFVKEFKKVDKPCSSDRFRFQLPKQPPEPILPRDTFALRFQKGMKPMF